MNTKIAKIPTVESPIVDFIKGYAAFAGYTCNHAGSSPDLFVASDEAICRWVTNLTYGHPAPFTVSEYRYTRHSNLQGEECGYSRITPQFVQTVGGKHTYMLCVTHNNSEWETMYHDDYEAPELPFYDEWHIVVVEAREMPKMAETLVERHVTKSGNRLCLYHPTQSCWVEDANGVWLRAADKREVREARRKWHVDPLQKKLSAKRKAQSCRGNYDNSRRRGDSRRTIQSALDNSAFGHGGNLIDMG